jgi:DNA processing protein
MGPRTFRDLVTYYGGVRPALTALPGLARRGGSPRPPYICSREEAERELSARSASSISCSVSLTIHRACK